MQENAPRPPYLPKARVTSLATISTIIPAYNAERTVARAIDSALSQDFESHEVIVVNDGSTDSTGKILAKYGNHIQVVTQRNGGLSVARNVGVKHSTGKHLALLDADDVWLPGKLRAMVSALERNPLASLAFSDYRCINNSGVDCGASAFVSPPELGKLLSQDPLPVHSFGSAILPSTWVITRRVFEHTGGFCEEFRGAQGFEDHWMILLLHERGEFVYVRQYLTLYQISEIDRLADKYAAGMPLFIALVKERYGVKSKRLIQKTKDVHCRWLLSKIAHQMNNGDKLGAMRSLARIAKLQPTYFLGFEFASRLFAPQNAKRIRKLISALPGIRKTTDLRMKES